MALSASTMSLTGLFGKFGIQDLTLPAFMFWRYAATSVLFFLSLLTLGRLQGFFQFHDLKIQILRAFFVLLAQYCFFYYLFNNTLLNAAALLNTGPVFISIIEGGLLRKKVGVSSWIGALVSFAGALMVLQPDTGIFSALSLVGLLSGVSQGASQVVFGFQTKGEEKIHLSLMHLFFLCTVLSLVPFLFFHTTMQPGKSFSAWDLGLIFALGATTLFSQSSRAQAYAHGTPSRLSAFLYLAVLLAGVYDWAIFGKAPNLLASLGAALIILGGLLKIYLRKIILEKRR
jgi:drug/metabolite transporter (DMT)-like permease